MPTARVATLAAISMLRELKTAHWTRRLTLLGRRYELRVRPGADPITAVRAARWRELIVRQEREPTLLADRDGRRHWWFEQRVYREDEDLEGDDVLALVRERERRRRRRLERAHAALAADGTPRREPIPRELRLAVFRRDGGRCAECGCAFDLQYDHVIPVALGGASTLANLQLLCSVCNQSKGASPA